MAGPSSCSDGRLFSLEGLESKQTKDNAQTVSAVQHKHGHQATPALACVQNRLTPTRDVGHTPVVLPDPNNGSASPPVFPVTQHILTDSQQRASATSHKRNALKQTMKVTDTEMKAAVVAMETQTDTVAAKSISV